MKYLPFFFLSCFSVLLHAQTEPLVSSHETKVESRCLQNLQGIVLIGNWEQFQRKLSSPVCGLVCQQVALLKEHDAFLRGIEEKYLGLPLTSSTMDQLKREICQFYQKQNQPLAIVSIPRQDLSQGVLQVVVDESKLGEIRTKGNRHFSSKWLKEAVRTEPGKTVVTRKILEDVAWLNLNPFRRTDAILVPGKIPGTTDIELVSADRWPYRVYAGADNTGTISTERNRLFFGFNFGKSLLKDGQISYQFTCAPNWNRFYAHTLSTRMPLPWRHILVFYGGYSQVKPNTEVNDLTDGGTSWQVDGRYRIPVFNNPNLMQEWIFGYDFKEISNRVIYNNVSPTKGTADINQFMIGYELGSRSKDLKVTLVAELYGNPGGITTDNKTVQYQNFRYDANCHYAYFKLAHSLAWQIPGKWWLSYNLRGQAASANLLPSEQLNMTGYEAVRGFEERIFSVDNGGIGNFTIETPHFSILKYFGLSKYLDEMYFLAFFDCGVGGNHKLAPNEAAVQSLGSVGPGVRYQVDQYLSLRFDYGVQLWHHGFVNPTDSRYNFGLILSY